MDDQRHGKHSSCLIGPGQRLSGYPPTPSSQWTSKAEPYEAKVGKSFAEKQTLWFQIVAGLRESSQASARKARQIRVATLVADGEGPIGRKLSCKTRRGASN